VRGRPRNRGDQAHLVTDAPQSRSAEISQRERRYLLLMGIRVACFIITVVLVVNHAGWIAAIPAAGAIVLPYFAVVVANARRQTSSSAGFRPYQPSLPARQANQAGPEPVPGQLDEPDDPDKPAGQDRANS
jgi:hypothetical protein